MKTLFRALTLLLCLSALCSICAASDAETLFHTQYCFTEGDFGESIDGIFVTQVPDSGIAVVQLGQRVIRAGDVLAAGTLDQLRLTPTCTSNEEAVLCYLPISEGTVGDPAALTIRIRSGKNEKPTASDGELETYRNVANDGKLLASDPEGAALTYRIETQPKRGTVELKEDGAYLYTPAKNKVGEDSFTFVAIDEAGNESKPATVKIRILKPSESRTFADLSGDADCFEAMWMRESGLYSGKRVGAEECFCPLEPVSRADFLVMTMELGKIPIEKSLTVSGFADAQDAPAWVQPYLAAAMRCGLVTGEKTEDGLMFYPNKPITGRQAAVLLQNLLKLPISTASAASSQQPMWAAYAVQALQEAGVALNASDEALNRMDAAKLLYAAASLPK